MVTRTTDCLRTIDWIAIALIIIGGLNWGLMAFANYDLLGAVFGNMGALSRIFYGLVGLAAIYMIVLSFGKLRRCDCRV